mmetsp:Transcript_24542/g.44769  ORF Transcript_24542/g.44769 Transcript_24542/m.44769 type:complete len:209 (-) Transcript_24542:71-697(-)
MLSMLETMHEDWQLPIWITEFACPPYQDCSADDNLKFMEAIVPQLDALDYVYRYSWFIDRQQNEEKVGGALLQGPLPNVTTPQRTALGEWYHSFDSFDNDDQGTDDQGGDDGCDACAVEGAYPTDLTDSQCTGLVERSVFSAEECQQACCSDKACNVWQFCAGGVEGSQCTVNSCWTGEGVDLAASCSTTSPNSPGWVGAGADAPPCA